MNLFQAIVRSSFFLGLMLGVTLAEDSRVEPIEVPLPIFDGRVVRLPTTEDELPPLQLQLSRERYWDVDGHLDLLVRLSDFHPASPGVIEVAVLDSEGRESARMEFPPPAAAFMVYPEIPGAILSSGEGSVTVRWVQQGPNNPTAQASFRVEKHDLTAPASGRIAVTIPAAPTSLSRLPVQIGLPFPRGVLTSTDSLRLVDGSGREIPFQVQEVARWSRHGSIKWVHGFFTADRTEKPETLYVEYGEGGNRATTAPAPWADLVAGSSHVGFPKIENGPLRLGVDGVWFDVSGEGKGVQMLEGEALVGAFVQREDGRIYRPDPATPFVVESVGSEQIVLRREGWYVEPTTKPTASASSVSEAATEGFFQSLWQRLVGRETKEKSIPRLEVAPEVEPDPEKRFCRYVTRYVIHRDSPLLRITHTWIFTGDGNRDRIANMGWGFKHPAALAPEGFLSAFGGEGEWLQGQALVQYDYEYAHLIRGGQTVPLDGLRTPGVAALGSGGARMVFGARDFWQNFPSELEFEGQILWFHNWPRNNPPARYRLDAKKIVPSKEPALPSAARHANYEEDTLTVSELKLNAVQLRFAHEGELLNFRLPDAYTEPNIDDRVRADRPWRPGEPESINAQGIARTEEMWLWMTPATTPLTAASELMEGLNAETLRAVVDPVWVAASGAFREMHHRDPERFPEPERIFDLVARSPGKITERLGIYGKWIYGDIVAWGPRLSTREPELYRAYRKRHHGWPYSWKPYARSGDPELLRLAQASTQRLIDSSYSHYSDEEVASTTPAGRNQIGLVRRSILPWGSGLIRSYEAQCDFYWYAWYLAANARAKETALSWMQESRNPERDPGWEIDNFGRQRGSMTLLKAYLDAWEATFDPWFLAGTLAVAQGMQQDFDRGGLGRTWETGHRDYLVFSGSPDYQRGYEAHARRHADPGLPGEQRWMGRHVQLPEIVKLWQLTGDDYYLRRAAHEIDFSTALISDDLEPDYQLGYVRRGEGTGYTLFTGYYLRWFPLGLWALAQVETSPPGIPNAFGVLLPANRSPSGARYREGHFVLRKVEADTGLPIALRSRFGSSMTNPPRAPDTLAAFEVRGPDGSLLLQGEWRMGDDLDLAIPAEAPIGEYRVTLTIRGETNAEVVLPLTPCGTPEVLLAQPGERLPFPREGTFWFFVPEDLAEFTVDFSGHQGAAIWLPDGTPVWRQSNRRDPKLAEVSVPSGQGGQLWRITLPGVSSTGSWSMDRKIPPVLAIDPTRWFLPEQGSRGDAENAEDENE